MPELLNWLRYLSIPFFLTCAILFGINTEEVLIDIVEFITKKW